MLSPFTESSACLNSNKSSDSTITENKVETGFTFPFTQFSVLLITSNILFFSEIASLTWLDTS